MGGMRMTSMSVSCMSGMSMGGMGKIGMGLMDVIGMGMTYMGRMTMMTTDMMVSMGGMDTMVPLLGV